ncbi:beta-lactamase [Gordoniibacillus kamchatkensis]|uniref:Beta-lactamase n=1 Tax=Gordoniibacillus kamchatkensis TaxID=1590651 RepID=A0ABR5AIB6_9BACL|nr:serine hydrolase [Paenibacillus sp. VKM B-2647]KIL40787.1 beta-lactamase [Paenibacillus sp. VKM B-2647]
MTVQQLPRSTPELQGMASGAVASFLKAVQDRGLELHSFMLVRHGHVVAEGWWRPYAPERPHMLFSLSKSFTSSAIGLLVEEGRLSLDDRVVSFFPEEAPAEPPPHLAAMTVRHLLMMGTGHAEDTTARMTESGNWVHGFLQLPVEHEPGTRFVYNSGATYMLSAILQKVTGTTLLAYLQPRLLEPLGIEGATWESCPRGIHVGGWGMKIRTEDIAKFGQLYLQKGLWNGRRLLSEAWVEEATSKHISNEPNKNIDWAQGYGYQFWRCRHGAYRGDGAFGQYCVVMPEQDAVIAITSGLGDMQPVLDEIWERLLPGMKSEPLPQDEAACAALGEALERLSLEPPRHEPAAELEQAVSGTVYELEQPNSAQLLTIAVQFLEDRAVVRFRNEQGEHAVDFGRNEWLEGTSALWMRDDQPLHASMTWRDATTLVLTVRYVETPFCLTAECAFGDGSVLLTARRNVGNREAEPIQGKAPG